MQPTITLAAPPSAAQLTPVLDSLALTGATQRESVNGRGTCQPVTVPLLTDTIPPATTCSIGSNSTTYPSTMPRLFSTVPPSKVVI